MSRGRAAGPGAAAPGRNPSLASGGSAKVGRGGGAGP